MAEQPPVTRADLVAVARAWIGTAYLHQASLRGVGCDCLGLVRGVWRDVYGGEPEPVPAYSAGWAEAGSGELLAAAAGRHMHALAPTAWRDGDLILFRWRAHLPAKHAAIATGPDSMVHAQDGARVCEVAVSGWWRRRIAYAFAFPGVTD